VDRASTTRCACWACSAWPAWRSPLVGIALIARLQGQTELGPLGVAALFGGVVSGVSGLSLFSLGVTFNYLVALFYKRPVRQGLFGRPLLPVALDRHFGWIGLAGLLTGAIVALASLALGLQGWPIDRLWLYLMGSALFILMGIQLVIDWVLLRVLEEQRQRELLVHDNLLSEAHETIEYTPATQDVI
jgi:hypothetical protein